MKKITLLAGLLIGALNVNAQDFYTFTKTTANYTDLLSPVSLNENQLWSQQAYGPEYIDFPVYIFGESFSMLGFNQDLFYFKKDTSTEYANLAPIFAFTQDRNITQTGNSESPISYKVEGDTGSRILKLELKNAGLEEEYYELNTTDLFLNYQIWLYESDNSIEFHFGPNNITNLEMLNSYGMYYSIFAYDGMGNDMGGVVTGDVTNPVYNEYIDENELTNNLDAMPTANTVYRFTVNSLAVQDQEKVTFSMFPNPTTNVLNLTFAEEVNKPYSVYDLLGREVLKGDINSVNQSQINVSTLQNGTYILRIAGSTQKFVKN